MRIWARRALAEGIGTFVLVFIGAGAAMVDAYVPGVLGHVGVALSFAFVVLAMIYSLGHVSGAHINPAVTLAFWSARRFPGRGVVPYLSAQCVGAMLASLVLRWVLGPVGGMGATVPLVDHGRAFVVEFLLSFILMFVIMAVATDDRVADGFAGLAVGLTVGVDALMGGPLTGASMNPARSLGPAMVGEVWAAHWIYWAAPISGMLVAARVYDLVRPSTTPDVPMGVQGAIDTTTLGESAGSSSPG